jgi:hypothetical protein
MLFAYRVQRAIVHARSRARLRSSEIDRGKRWFLGGASLGGEERIASLGAHASSRLTGFTHMTGRAPRIRG